MVALAACQPGEPPDSGATADLEPAGADDKPNILFVMADDLGYLDPGFFGSEIRTPNLDALASRGLKFTNFHAAPICASTRAMLMSGTTFIEAGVAAMDAPLLANVATMPERLSAAGYHTYMAGKWNLGTRPEDGPAARGFDSSYVLMKAADNHLGHNLFPGSPPTYEGHATYLENGEPVELPEDWFSSRVYTDKLIEYIGANSGDGVPWFGYLALTAPHWPLQVPEDWLDRYAGRYDQGYGALLEERYAEAKRRGIIPSNLDLAGFTSVADPWESLSEQERSAHSRSMEVYAALVENMDMHIGRVVDFLAESGQLENTVIVFSSDNGAARETSAFQPTTIPRTDTDNSLANIGREGSFSALGPGWAEAAMASYRALKGSLLEGGTLVPAFISYRDVTNKNGLDHSYLTIMDLLPTFLDIAEDPVVDAEFQGGPVLPVRGESFWGLATGTSTQVRTASDVVPWVVPLSDSYPTQTALVRWPWKLYGASSGGDIRWSLFNLESDPGERQDLASEHSELTAELIAIWQASGQ